MVVNRLWKNQLMYLNTENDIIFYLLTGIFTDGDISYNNNGGE